MTVIATASNPRFTSAGSTSTGTGRPTPSTRCVTCANAVRPEGASCSSSPAPTRWRRSCPGRTPTQMFELAHFIGVTRPGFELSDEHLPADTVSLVQVPAMAISSTDCRARVAAGKPVWYLVPDGVVQYIAKRRLYRWPDIASVGPVPSRTSVEYACERLDAVDASTGRGDTVPATERALELALAAAQAAADKKAEDIVIIDVADQLVITDAFLIASAPNERQVHRHRRRDRGEPAAAAGEGQAGPPRGRAGGPLGAAGLHRHRGARPAHRGARVLRPRPAVEGLPDDPVRRPRPRRRRRSPNDAA